MTQESTTMPIPLELLLRAAGIEDPEKFLAELKADKLVWADSIVAPINAPVFVADRPSGGRTNYYLVRVSNPQREDQPAYTAECEDIIEALGLNFDEANMFKEIWRSANARTHGNAKIGHSAIYGAEKLVHYAGRILRRMKIHQSVKKDASA